MSKLTNVNPIKNLCAVKENPFLLQIGGNETSEKANTQRDKSVRLAQPFLQLLWGRNAQKEVKLL